MSGELLRSALRALPFVLFAGAVADSLELFEEAHGRPQGHAIPELGPLEVEAGRLLSSLLAEDQRLLALESAFRDAGILPSDPLAVRLRSLNQWQDMLLHSASSVKAELAVADMTGTYRGNAAATRGTIAQLTLETRGLSGDIDALERDARARGITVLKR